MFTIGNERGVPIGQNDTQKAYNLSVEIQYFTSLCRE